MMNSESRVDEVLGAGTILMESKITSDVGVEKPGSGQIAGVQVVTRRLVQVRPGRDALMRYWVQLNK